MSDVHECDCCDILDKIMVIEGSADLIKQNSHELNAETLKHFERIQRSINVIYDHVRKNQRTTKCVCVVAK